jgi:hypothetical protein
MNTAKLTILKDTFENQFNLDRFKKFTREFFNEPEMLPDNRRTGIWREYDNHINSYYTIAKYTDSENNNLIVLAVELKKDGSIDRARSMQRNFISKVLDENKLEAAIVAFYTENDPSWRLSLVRLDYSFKETGIYLDLTPARRYSYLLGENEPNNTAQAQLLPIFEDDRHNPTLDEIENAFSVEKVTKDFYSLYEEKYFSLKEYLENDSAFIAETLKLGFEVGKFSEQFAKKLMGQLAFLYFLQKKGWLGVRIMPEDHTLTEAEFRKIYTGQDQAHKNVMDKVFKMTKDKSKKLSSKELNNTNGHEAALLSDCFIGTDFDMPWGSGNRTFIREIFDFCINHTQKNFFDDYLEPFFYEALNTKRKNQYFKTFNCKIPFLNGGLFEPLEGYHWKDIDFEIPNELFSNRKQKGREDDGILDIFDRFNFTINEDEPLEKEVAVDPEMLGKIFENLLDASDRKSKGAFYTPREIVHYMCQESLINYLVNEANVPYEDMKQFILYGELIRDADSRSGVGFRKELTIKQTIYDNIVKIDDALKNVRVADPAVGSGAFPLGMVNEIVKTRNNITEYIIRKDKEGFFDKRFGEEFIKKWRAPYKMKWDTIKNCIFAVDIEPSAVDIAKLRLWLSVVVEQEINAENPEPHPLPNLDMNIHVGNSLIDEYEGIKLFDKSILGKRSDEGKGNGIRTASEAIQMSFLIDHTDEILKEMFAYQDRYFDEDNEESKKGIKCKIDQIRDELIRYKLQIDNNTEALKRYKESLKNKTKPYFIWEMEFAKIFREKGGFDIVIGNPPYVQLQKDGGFLADQLQGIGFEVFERTGDIYCLFYEKGNRILRKNGHLCFITSNKWMRAGYGNSLRKYLAKATQPKLIIDLGAGIFETATVDTNILLFKKDEMLKEMKGCNYSDKGMPISQAVSNNSVNISVPINGEAFIILNNKSQSIRDKMENIGIPLKEWDISINYGIKTGFNKAFIIDTATKDELISRDSKSAELIWPILRGKDIKRYTANWADLWLINTHNGFKTATGTIGPINVNKYPAIKRHLDQYYEQLKKRADQGVTPYNLRNCAYVNDFKKEKIIFQEIVQEPMFCYDESDHYFCVDTGRIITTEKVKYLIAFLNSALFFYSMKYYYGGGGLGNTGIRMKHTFFQNCPVVVPTNDINNRFVEIVDRILVIKGTQQNADTTKLEKQIDQMVYELYGLTDEEIKIVEEG